MNVLEKILEEIKKPTNYTIMCGKHYTTLDRVEEIIRSHMDEREVFKFDFNRVKSFDCQCGRHYVNTYDGGWIPVDERLPEEGQEVLATHKPALNPEYQVIEHYYHNREFLNNWHMDMDFHSKTFGQRYMGDVIAWQPLPEPYIKNPK